MAFERGRCTFLIVPAKASRRIESAETLMVVHACPGVMATAVRIEWRVPKNPNQEMREGVKR